MPRILGSVSGRRKMPAWIPRRFHPHVQSLRLAELPHVDRPVKRHLICDGRGVPLAVRLTVANRNDSQEALVLVDAIPPLHGERGDRGSGRTVCSGIAATMRPLFGAVSEFVTSCPCWPCVAPRTEVACAGGGGSWSAHFPGLVSFAVCGCGTKSGSTSTRRSSRSDAR
jgi:hypothetical protein